MIKIQCTHAVVDTCPMHKPKVNAFDDHQHQRTCTGFESFLEQQNLKERASQRTRIQVGVNEFKTKMNLVLGIHL